MPGNDPIYKEFIAIVTVMVAGLVAKTLVSDEPFNQRKFIGEMIISAIFAVSIFSFGIIQDMGFWQMLLISSLAGLGTTRSLEWIVKLSKVASKGGA